MKKKQINKVYHVLYIIKGVMSRGYHMTIYIYIYIHKTRFSQYTTLISRHVKPFFEVSLTFLQYGSSGLLLNSFVLKPILWQMDNFVFPIVYFIGWKIFTYFQKIISFNFKLILFQLISSNKSIQWNILYLCLKVLA